MERSELEAARKENSLLKTEVKELKDAIKKRDNTIDKLMTTIKERDEKVKDLENALHDMREYREKFEKNLFKLLVEEASIDPEKITWRLGIGIKKDQNADNTEL